MFPKIKWLKGDNSSSKVSFIVFSGSITVILSVTIVNHTLSKGHLLGLMKGGTNVQQNDIYKLNDIANPNK